MYKRLSSLLFFNLVLLLACNPKMDLGLEKKSSITTDGAKEVSSTTAVLNGTVNLVSSAYDDIIVGFQYSSSIFHSSNSTYIEVLKQVQTPNCSYSATIIGLEPATKYYYRAFMREKEVESFGETKEFITLAPTKVSSISLNKKTLELAEGETEPLIATITPSNSDDKSLVWSSSDEKVATVSQTGIVTAISKGSATIEVRAIDGSEKYATCSVTVVKLVSSITINKSFLVLPLAKKETLTATIIPSDASNTEIVWDSSNPEIASVSSEGEVYGKKTGKVTISAKALDASRVTGVCEVEVVRLVKDISLDELYFDLSEGEHRTLVATVTPANASDKSLTWSTDNPSVVSIDQNGQVKGLARGKALIMVSANDGSGKTANCDVEVITYAPGEAVDLGLSVKWSSINLGATKPEEYGLYYRWGEVDSYCGKYPSGTYKWYYKEFVDIYSYYGWRYTSYLIKYCTSIYPHYWGGEGDPDEKTDFKDYDYVDDAARARLGGKWRTPTDTEWTELLNNCGWKWTDNYNGTGVSGMIVTSKKNYKKIFLPAAGLRNSDDVIDIGLRGRYWCSSIVEESSKIAWTMVFTSSNKQKSYDHRHSGLSVRPVSE